MSKTLSFILVVGNRDASLANAAAAYDKHIAERETEEQTISEAVHSVFDQYPGAALTMPTIEGMTLRVLNAQPSNWKALGKRVLEYVRANSDRTAVKDDDGNIVTPAEAPRTRTFGISKGVGGGVKRWADVPESDTSSDNQ